MKSIRQRGTRPAAPSQARSPLMGQAGLSLIETMMALAVLVVVLLGIAHFASTAIHNIKSADYLNDANLFDLEIKRYLTVPKICNATFAPQAPNLPLGPAIPNVIHPDLMSPLYSAGTTYHDGKVRLNSMKVSDFQVVDAETDRFIFNVEIEVMNASNTGGQLIQKRHEILVMKRAGAFLTCYTMGDLGLMDQYVLEFGSDVKEDRFTIVGMLSVIPDSVGNGGMMRAERYFELSDRALKTSIEDLKDAKATALALDYYQYRVGGKETYGVMAQQLSSIAPHLVTEDADDHHLMVSYNGLIPVVVGSIQELRDEQRDSKAKIRQMRQRMRASFAEIQAKSP